jgi:NAD(P)-dependent dehydrogenase (short-subunit alcohol dehydrogenase family)
VGRIAIITGASRGLGEALAEALVGRGWSLVIDARGARPLEEVGKRLRVTGASVVTVAGDVSDESHQWQVIEAAEELGGVDLVVNNASFLGPSPQPLLADYPLDVVGDVYRVNVIGPLGLIQKALPSLRSRSGRIINLSSDAAMEAYEGWGGYGSSKAALDHLTAVLAAENRDLRVYAVDPGDMNTQMHQEAFPGEDISDRPQPSASIPGLLQLIEGDLPSGRYQAGAIEVVAR